MYYDPIVNLDLEPLFRGHSSKFGKFCCFSMVFVFFLIDFNDALDFSASEKKITAMVVEIRIQNWTKKKSECLPQVQKIGMSYKVKI